MLAEKSITRPNVIRRSVRMSIGMLTRPGEANLNRILGALRLILL
jgi:hypothetical protein